MLAVSLTVGCGDDVPDVAATPDGLPGDTSAAAETEGDEDETGEPGGSSGGEIEPEVDWPTLECDPIAPSYCAFPYPSNVFTVPDAEATTGRRLQLSVSAFPAATNEPWERLDGFSPSAAISVHLPGATAAGLPGHEDPDASLAQDARILLLDAQTGERVPLFAELDYSTADPEQRSLMIRPLVRLEGATRYIVALRGIEDEGGEPLAASEAFAALRDELPMDDEPSVDARRGLYADIFARLADAGVERDEVQLAWDFTTASDEAVTEPMLHIRDETFAALGESSPPYTIDDVDTEWFPEDFLMKLTGTFEAPLYLDSTEVSQGRLLWDAQGRPRAEGTVDVPFTMIVPRVAEDAPVALLQHGHGLFGTRSQIESDHFRDVATQYGHAIFAIDWVGMSDEDALGAAGTILAGNANGLASMMDRLHQGTLQQLLMMRVAHAGLAQDPMLAGLLDADLRYYYGISQGGILGGVYMATSTEVERGVLDVMGQPYNLLLTRSVDFDAFFELMRMTWPDGRDVQYVLAVTQSLWDRVEPAGYSPFIREDPLPGTPPHEILMTAALGDHQVPTLGAHVMARSIPGVVHLDTGLREVWGLESVEDSHMGSAYVEYDFGLPPDPWCSQPQRACDDPHGKLRKTEAARDQIDLFLRTGEIRNFCADGRCEFADLSGCEDAEPVPDPCQ